MARSIVYELTFHILHITARVDAAQAIVYIGFTPMALRCNVLDTGFMGSTLRPSPRHPAMRINMCSSPNLCDRPLAAPGLTSYRYAGRYGWIMIGATDDAGALREAQRSTRDAVTADRLQVWGGHEYQTV